VENDRKPEVTPRQAAKALAVTPRTITNYIREGKLTARREGKRVFIPIEEIEKLRMKISQKKEFPEKSKFFQEISSPSDESFRKISPSFHFDPAQHIILSREEWQETIRKLGQYEERLKLLEGPKESGKDERPWWKRLFRRT